MSGVVSAMSSCSSSISNRLPDTGSADILRQRIDPLFEQGQRYHPMSAEKKTSPRALYITPEGAARLRAELDFLWRVKRPRVTQAVTEAAAQGDRSENAEYIYGKKQLREIDKRVRFLRKRLDELTVVERLPAERHRVFFGAWVTLEDEAGNEQILRIVGPDEFDPARNWISVNSPMAKALIGRAEDDEVVVRLPKGEAHYLILEVSYEGDGSQPFVEPEWA